MNHQQANIIRLAEAAVRKAERQARHFYSIQLPDAEIDFSLRGRCAGQAKVEPRGHTLIRINLTLLAQNLDDFVRHTIPHEVAHLVVGWMHRKKRQRPRPHGKEWQAIMRDCYQLDPVRCHSYETTPARVVPRNYLYRCTCREHHLTSIMHNKISRRYRVTCKFCSSPLHFVTKATRPGPAVLRFSNS